MRLFQLFISVEPVIYFSVIVAAVAFCLPRLINSLALHVREPEMSHKVSFLETIPEGSLDGLLETEFRSLGPDRCYITDDNSDRKRVQVSTAMYNRLTDCEGCRLDFYKGILGGKYVKVYPSNFEYI